MSNYDNTGMNLDYAYRKLKISPARPYKYYRYSTWRKDPHVTPLDGARGVGARRGEIGVMTFSCGIYPACSIHGAMNAVGNGKWRCLAEGCNIGAQTPWPWRG